MITKATADEIPQLVKLINSAYRGEESKKGWTTEADLLEGERTNADTIATMMSRETAAFLKYENVDAIEGCVYLEKRNDNMYLGMLTVSPTLQAKGIGKKLLSASEEYARRQNCSVVEMNVISVRTELIAWYERHGYERTGETKPFPVDANDIAKQPLEFVVLHKKL